MRLCKYQKDIVSDVISGFHNGDIRQLAVLATGGGKTIIAADLVSFCSYKMMFTLFVVHRTSLIQQTIDKFSKFKIYASGCSGNHKPDPLSPCVVTTWQSLKFNGEPRKGLIDKDDDGEWRFWIYNNYFKYIEVIILDEAHQTTYADKLRPLIPPIRGFEKYEEEWMNPNKEYYRYEEKPHRADDNDPFIIGLTATPWRLNKSQYLSDYFNIQILGATVFDLQKKKRLAKAKYKIIDPPAELEKLKIKMGDYSESSIASAYTTPAALDKFKEQFQKYASGRQSIIFCSTVDHARHVADSLKDLINVEVVVASTPYSDRLEIFKRFEKREVNCLVSVGALSEGFDSPIADCVVLCRPTKSKALAIQMVGRGLRSHKDKQNCLILDFAGVVVEHGAVEDYDSDEYSMYPASNLLVNDKFIELEPKEYEQELCPECDSPVAKSAYKCWSCGTQLREVEDNVYIPELVDYTPVKLSPQAQHFQENLLYYFDCGRHPKLAELTTKLHLNGCRISSAWYKGAIPRKRAGEYFNYLADHFKNTPQSGLELFKKIFGLTEETLAESGLL